MPIVLITMYADRPLTALEWQHMLTFDGIVSLHSQDANGLYVIRLEDNGQDPRGPLIDHLVNFIPCRLRSGHTPWRPGQIAVGYVRPE